ncbi:major facilitator superfamily domain-containing protein [Fennellomyces sp. T-0311]|nr:major facilitator superfamily domain-containing protein [Fennellomyces sp. T-0311]
MSESNVQTEANATEKRSLSGETITDAPYITRLVKSENAQRIFAFAGLQLALFLSALDSTIISTSLPRIGSDFNQMSLVAWVSTAYLLTFDGFQPLFSKFSDIFGRKWILLFGICVFLIASILCGTSQSIVMLIAGRSIQGIGAAGTFSMVFVIISDIVPPEKRGSYQGVINGVFALASIFGPLIGGSFTDYVSWRWNFYINLPIGVLALFLILFFLHLPTPKGRLLEKLRRIDYLGTFNVLAFSTLFLLAMNFGGQTFPWRSAAVIVPLVLSAVMVGLLILVEIKFAKEPLMPPRLFKIRSVVSILITNWFFGITFFSIAYYLPMYLQVVRGDSAMWSGIRMIPMQITATVFATITGVFISKTGIYRPLIIFGTAILTLCVGLISILDIHTDYAKIYGFTTIGGVGLGLIFSAAIIGLQAAAEPRDIAVVTGLGNFSRILGGALGVSIAAAILNSSLHHDLPGRIPEPFVDMVIGSPESLKHHLPVQYFGTVMNVYMSAIKLIWHVMIPMAGVAFISSLFIQHHSIVPPPSPSQPENNNNEQEVPKKEQLQTSVRVDNDEVNSLYEK